MKKLTTEEGSISKAGNGSPGNGTGTFRLKIFPDGPKMDLKEKEKKKRTFIISLKRGWPFKLSQNAKLCCFHRAKSDFYSTKSLRHRGDSALPWKEKANSLCSKKNFRSQKTKKQKDPTTQLWWLTFINSMTAFRMTMETNLRELVCEESSRLTGVGRSIPSVAGTTLAAVPD